MDIAEIVECLRCPVTGKSLKLASVGSGQETGFVRVPRKGRDVKPIQGGGQMLVAEDESFAYPIADGIPVLLGPEKLLARRAADDPIVDLQDPMYAEAYEEMEFYNDPRVRSPLRSIMGALTEHEDIASIAHSFPEPARFWIDSLHESLAQLEAYDHLAPVAGKTVLQIGGSGSHAVKMLLAGAERGFLITPMAEEARYAERIAESFGVRSRFAPLLGIGEQLPFVADCIDRVYSGGCFHHMRLKHVGAELHRVLTRDGKFSGCDLYTTPLHTIGATLLGKREKSVYCRPLTSERLMEMKRWFPDMTAHRHGPLLRYLFLGLEKLSLGYFRLPLPVMMNLMHLDNSLGRFAHPENTGGGIVVTEGTK